VNPEVKFVLDALDGVVDAQPDAHPLRRVDRNSSRVYDGGGTLDMTQPIHDRTDDLLQANYVSVALQTRDNDPIGTEYNLATDMVASVRVEALLYGEAYGHAHPDGKDGRPVFDDLYHDIRGALLDERTYPQDSAFRDAKLELQVVNEDYQSSEWADFFRREFDLVFRGRESL